MYLFFLNLVEAIVFPTPTTQTRGWHPVGFVHEHFIGTPAVVNFVDQQMVLWKGSKGYHLRPDVCPHRGARLSLGTLENDCITCTYHGLVVGPYDNAHPECQEDYGICKEHQGIIWWANDPKEPTDTIPHCDELDEAASDANCRLSTVIDASFSDCFANGMDFHHAAFVHKNTFGNYAGEPDLVEERWNTKGQLEGNFMYGSNDVYTQYTGGETDNSHVFCYPSTTYNIVNGKGKYMIIHVAMRALTEYKTVWYLTATSNFVPSGPIGDAILNRMVRKVAIDEDARQLANMASDPEKLRHSFKFQLPLDNIYSAWNKNYDKADELENCVFQVSKKGYVDGSDTLEILAQKLKAFNNTLHLNNAVPYTNWELIWAPHKFPGTRNLEMFQNGRAREFTQLKNGTLIEVRADVSYSGLNMVTMTNLDGREYYHKTPLKVPFTKHAFETYYISRNLFVRKGLETGSWEILERKRTKEELSDVIDIVNWEILCREPI